MIFTYIAAKILVVLGGLVLFGVPIAVAVVLTVCVYYGYNKKHPVIGGIVGVLSALVALGAIQALWTGRGAQEGRDFLLNRTYAQWADDTHTVEINRGTEVQRFILVSVNPPKHMYVTLKGMDGKIYENLHIAKHCSKWRDLQPGAEYNVLVSKYSKSNAPDVVLTRWTDLYSTFCS